MPDLDLGGHLGQRGQSPVRDAGDGGEQRLHPVALARPEAQIAAQRSGDHVHRAGTPPVGVIHDEAAHTGRSEPGWHNRSGAELAGQETPNDRDALLPCVVGEPPSLPHIPVEPLELGFDLPV